MAWYDSRVSEAIADSPSLQPLSHLADAARAARIEGVMVQLFLLHARQDRLGYGMARPLSPIDLESFYDRAAEIVDYCAARSGT